MDCDRLFVIVAGNVRTTWAGGVATASAVPEKRWGTC